MRERWNLSSGGSRCRRSTATGYANTLSPRAIPKRALQSREFIAFHCKSLWVKYPLAEGGTTPPCSSQVTSSLFCCPLPAQRNYCLPGPGERAPKNLRLRNDTLKPLWVFMVSRDEGSRAHDWPAEESQHAATILSLPGSRPTGSAQPLYSHCPVLSPRWHHLLVFACVGT